MIIDIKRDVSTGKDKTAKWSKKKNNKNTKNEKLYIGKIVSGIKKNCEKFWR